MKIDTKKFKIQLLAHDIGFKEFAEGMGITRQRLWQISNGRHNVSEMNVKKISEALGCSAEEIIVAE